MRIVESEDRTFREELNTCPDCGDFLHLVDSIESTGEGAAFGYVSCISCPFKAREEWVHDVTRERVDSE